MERHWEVFAAVALTAFVFFHTPDGKVIGVNPSDGQIIIRPAPPGFHVGTMIETGVGSPFIVTESLCDVAHALERKCKMDQQKEAPK
jgi:hypothetical protein